MKPSKKKEEKEKKEEFFEKANGYEKEYIENFERLITSVEAQTKVLLEKLVETAKTLTIGKNPDMRLFETTLMRIYLINQHYLSDMINDYLADIEERMIESQDYFCSQEFFRGYS